MVTYHVATDGNNANDGLSRANAFRSPKAVVDIAASGSEALLYYDPATDIEFTEGVELTIDNSLIFVGVDSAGVRADDVLTNGANTLWNKDEQPTIIWTGSFTGRCVEPQTGDRFTAHGITFHGSGTAVACVTNTATTSEIRLYDCILRDPNNTASGNYPLAIMRSSDQAHRCFLIGGEHNLNIGTAATASFCILSGSNDESILLSNGLVQAYIENCLIMYGNADGGSTNDQFVAEGTGQNIKNCIAYNNQSQYGWDITTQTGADYLNAWTTNSGSFHTVGPYDGSPGANHISSDPQFINPITDGDYRLASTSELLTAGTSAGIVGTLTYDLQAITGDYPIGPYMGLPVMAWAFTEGSGSCNLIDSDFTINTTGCRKRDYNKAVDAIPFGLATPGPISLRQRNTPYRLTR